MRRRVGSLLLVVGMLFVTCAWAQTDTGTSDSTAPIQPGPKPAFTYPDATPSLDFLNPALENSSVTLGIGGGFTYDSNQYRITNQSQSWWLFHVTPSIRIQQFFPRFSWNASYAPGYQYQTRPSGTTYYNNNLFSQSARAGLLWQLARRWQLSASDNFSYSANPFDSYLTIPGTPTMNNPNPVIYSPLSNYELNYGLMTLTDQLSKVDTLTFTGTANLRRTSTYNLITSVPFYNLVSYGGRADYSHRFSQRLSVGAGYDYNSLDFGKGQQRSGVQTISITGEYLIRPNMSISGWVGPEYTSTKNVVGIPIFGQIHYFIEYSSLWSTSLGANFSWKGRRDSVRAGFSRGVSDGGGILATTQVNSVNGDYRRMIVPKLNIALGGRYSHSVSTTVSSRSYDILYLNAGLTYNLAKSLTATGTYGYVRQTQTNTILLGGYSYNANVVGASINYTWNHPLGR